MKRVVAGDVDAWHELWAAASVLVLRSRRSETTVAPEPPHVALTPIEEPAPAAGTPQPAQKMKPAPATVPAAPISTPPPQRRASLTPSQISLVVASNRTELQRMCWAPRNATAQSMNLRSVRVDLTLAIAPSGKPERADATTSDRRLSDVGACVATRAKQWQFPAAPSASRVTVPFVFQVNTAF